MREAFISASLACADFGRLFETIQVLEETGIAFFHFDIADGYFAPTFLLGPSVLASWRKDTKVSFEVSLTCWSLERFVARFVETETDYIVYYLGATGEPEGVADSIREQGIKPVIALCPETPLKCYETRLQQGSTWLLFLRYILDLQGNNLSRKL